MIQRKKCISNLPHVFFLLFLASLFIFLIGALIWNSDTSLVKLLLVFGGIFGMIFNGIGFTMIVLYQIYIGRSQGNFFIFLF